MEGLTLITNIYFVRHAHSTYTPDELRRPLSEQGFNDALQVTEILKNENIDWVISSPYKRAYQTVEGVSKVIEKEILLIDDFRERTLSEGPVEDFSIAIHKVWQEPSFAFEGGESNLQAQERGVKAILRILEEFEGKNIVIGTHGNLMALTMNYFDFQYDFHFWQDLDMPDVYKLTFNDKNLQKVTRLWSRKKQLV